MVKTREIIGQFRAAVKEPFVYARTLKENQHRPVIGHTCSYFPEEIVLAAGGHPLRLFGKSSVILKADAHIQAYGCSLVRSVFEDALSGQLDFLDVMAFPHSCDTMQRLSDIWRLNIPNTIHLDLLFPVQLQGEAAKDYMEAVLTRFRQDLESAIQVDISEAAILKAVSLMNRIRRALAALYQFRSAHWQSISGSDLAEVVQGAMIMDRSEVAELLEELVASLRKTPLPTDSSPVKQVLLSGGVCLHPDIHNIIEEQGGAVLWDDLCTGSRYFDTTVAENLPPIAALADRFLNRAICPAKHRGITRRRDDLLNLASTHRIDGAIFFFLKFCDPHGFDYPDLKIALEQAGIPTLFLEVETGKPVDGATRTRLETFLQILNQEKV